MTCLSTYHAKSSEPILVILVTNETLIIALSNRFDISSLSIIVTLLDKTFENVTLFMNNLKLIKLIKYALDHN